MVDKNGNLYPDKILLKFYPKSHYDEDNKKQLDLKMSLILRFICKKIRKKLKLDMNSWDDLVNSINPRDNVKSVVELKTYNNTTGFGMTLKPILLVNCNGEKQEIVEPNDEFVFSDEVVEDSDNEEQEPSTEPLTVVKSNIQEEVNNAEDEDEDDEEEVEEEDEEEVEEEVEEEEEEEEEEEKIKSDNL